MKTWALALALVLVCTQAQAEPDIVKSLRELIWPPKTQAAPPVVSKPKPVADSPKPKPAPAPVPESPRVKSNPPKQADRSRPKPVPQKVQEKPPGWVCVQIGMGLNTVDRAHVIEEGAKRGYSRATTEKAIAACGY